MQRMIWTIALSVVAIYAGLLILLRLAEPRLIYSPGRQRHLLPPPAELRLSPQRIEIPTDDSVTLVGWVISAPPESSGGLWLLMCHGNAGNLSEFDRPVHYAGLRRLGLNLLAFDYRGYGESGGSPSEQGLYRDAQAAYRYLRETRRVPPDRIIVFGHSLGSTVAVDLVRRVPVAGLILDGALTCVVDRGQELYPYIPVRWIAGSQFNSLEKIPAIQVPKLFLHGVNDDVVPLSHGRRLFAAAVPPKTFVELQAGHGDGIEVDSANYFGSIARFLASL